MKSINHRRSQERSISDYLVLATNARDNGDFEEGLKHAYAGLELPCSDMRVNSTLIYRLGTLYRDMGNTDLAVKKYNEAIDLDPKFAWPHIGLGNIYRDLKDFNKAIEEYKTAIRLNPNDPMAHNNLGFVYEILSDFDKAQNLYEKATSLGPKKELYKNNLVKIKNKQSHSG